MPAELYTHAWVKSVPKRLKGLGYRTGILGKVHVLPRSVYPFDVEPETDDPGGGQTRDPKSIGQQARAFLAQSGGPFFLVVGFHDPHRDAVGFGNEHARDQNAEHAIDIKSVVVPHFLPDRPEVRAELAQYAQAVTRLDRGVGEVLDALAQSNQGGGVLIIFLSDNGMPFPGAKTTLYDPGIHLPLIVATPAGARSSGRTSRAMVSWVDIAPTILEWAGAPAEDLPGRSLLPILDVENTPAGTPSLARSYFTRSRTITPCG
jgi:N-sulfoglucosamine sulfohydrolase